jgi:hypothetical protein
MIDLLEKNSFKVSKTSAFCQPEKLKLFQKFPRNSQGQKNYFYTFLAKFDNEFDKIS